MFSCAFLITVSIVFRTFQMNVRTLSHSLADTAVTAAGHAMDNLSGWLDTSAPAGKADKAKLSRVASLTPEVAAKLQQAVSL